MIDELVETAAPYDKALALSYSISEGENFRTHHPGDPNDEYVSEYISLMKEAAKTSNFEVKSKDSRRRRRRRPQSPQKHITSLPSWVPDSFNDSLTTIRTFCEDYLKIWAKIDDDSVGGIWFQRMHEPRVHEFSEYSSLKANSSNATLKPLKVCAFESDPTVISMCFIFV